MSLPRLADGSLLLAALTDVAETSLFAYVDAIDEERFAGAEPGAAPWLRASLQFSGPLVGTMTVDLPSGAAATFAAAFAGDQGVDPPDEALVEDFAGEFANTVCGAWLTRACPEHAFILSPPAVERRDHPPSQRSPETIHVAIGDAPVRFGVAFEAPAADAAPPVVHSEA